jgi:hypothetical protein
VHEKGDWLVTQQAIQKHRRQETNEFGAIIRVVPCELEAANIGGLCKIEGKVRTQNPLCFEQLLSKFVDGRHELARKGWRRQGESVY